MIITFGGAGIIILTASILAVVDEIFLPNNNK
jgi:hypothetical protein